MFQKYTFLVLVLFYFGCKSDSFNFPETPALTLQSIEQYKLNGKDSSVAIFINYTDGDGDIGLEAADTNPPYQYNGPYFYNLLINVYTVENGISKPLYFPATTDTINFNDRIATLTPTGKNKAISGVIRLNLNAKPYFSLTPDSMFYSVQIIDRKLHKSNVVFTPVRAFVF
ncbi:MAG TPA: hypothetical protein VGF79_00695 [Bacteroidia bacterium]